MSRVLLTYYIITRAKLLQCANELFSWMAEDSLRVRIDTTFPLAEAAKAHRYLVSRQTRGKVLLIPA